MTKIKGELGYKVLRPFIKVYFKLKYHPTVYGGENIPKSGPIVVCGNHRHTHDQFNVMIVTNRVIHYMAKKEYFDNWKTRWFFKAVGCPKCFGTGFSGRRAIYEVYRMTEEMRNIIYKTQDLVALKKAANASGALNLRANGWHKVVRGLTTIDEILSITTADE